MTRTIHLIAQSMGIIGQMVVPTLPLAAEWMTPIHAGIGAVQAIVALIGHQHNPDGTTCYVAYIPEKPRLGQGE